MRWKVVPGFPDYEVSVRGVVRRRTPGRGTYVGRVLKPCPNDQGYLSVTLNGTVRISVHRLVCRTFNGPPPSPRHEATHRNGRKLQNYPHNLRWRTHRQNIADKIRHGTVVFGARHHATPLTARKVRRIRRIARLKVGFPFIGQQYGISRQAVWAIVHRKTWKHIK